MKIFKNIVLALVLFSIAYLVTNLVSKPLAVFYDQKFHPNYGWWGSPDLVTWPLSYEFFIIFLFSLWKNKFAIHSMVIFLLPMLLLWGVSIMQLNLNGFLLLLVPGLVAFGLATLINKLLPKAKTHQNQ